jgi:hypothetical protein
MENYMAGAGTTISEMISKIVDTAGSGRDLLREIAIAQLVDDSNHVFSDKITEADVRGLKLMARISRTILAHPAESERLSGAILQGDWAAVREIATLLAGKSDVSPENALSYCLALLYVPACAADAFAVAAVTHGKADAGAYQSDRPTRITPEHVKYVSNCRTREAMVRSAAYASLSWLRDSKQFQFGLDQADNRQRFERFSKVLGFLADNPSSYSDIMSHVAKEDWIAANDAAIRLIEIGQAGESVAAPPALADILTIALMPICHTDLAAKMIQTRSAHR